MKYNQKFNITPKKFTHSSNDLRAAIKKAVLKSVWGYLLEGYGTEVSKRKTALDHDISYQLVHSIYMENKDLVEYVKRSRRCATNPDFGKLSKAKFLILPKDEQSKLIQELAKMIFVELNKGWSLSKACDEVSVKSNVSLNNLNYIAIHKTNLNDIYRVYRKLNKVSDDSAFSELVQFYED